MSGYGAIPPAAALGRRAVPGWRLGWAGRQSAAAGFSTPGALGTAARVNSAPVVTPWFGKFWM